MQFMTRMVAAAGILFLSSSVMAYADRIGNPAPPVGQVLNYTVSGGGAGTLVLPGSDQSMPLDLETDVSLKRQVTEVQPDGSIITEQSITQNVVTVNGEEIGLGSMPGITITTGPDGKVARTEVNGRAEQPVGPAALQSFLAIWQLPNKEFKAGDTWTENVPLPSRKTEEKAPEVHFTQSYLGLKPWNGQPTMALTTHLEAPVTLTSHAGRGITGITLSSVKINSLDQTGYYDPHSGALLASDTNLTMDLNGKLGGGDTGLPITIKMPVMLKTRLAKTNAGAHNSTGGSTGESKQAPNSQATGGTPPAPGSGDSNTTPHDSNTTPHDSNTTPHDSNTNPHISTEPADQASGSKEP